MTTSLLSDAFAHHVWATERLIDACTALTREQLTTPTPGALGSIMDMLGDLVGADGWYLSFFSEQAVGFASTTLADFRSAAMSNGQIWMQLLSEELDPDQDVVARDDEGGEFHAPLGLRLAQVIHHGSDHRSRVCTAMTSLGVTPPLIDLWDFGESTGRTRDVPAPARQFPATDTG